MMGGIEMSSFYYIRARAHERIYDLHREAAASAAERAVSKNRPHPVYALLQACVKTALAMFALVPAIRLKAMTWSSSWPVRW
jgi:hypothetical protein